MAGEKIIDWKIGAPQCLLPVQSLPYSSRTAAPFAGYGRQQRRAYTQPAGPRNSGALGISVRLYRAAGRWGVGDKEIFQTCC